MSNIREIAEKVGVSVTTVSRVLNDHPYVSEEKRKAVEQAIEQLNYTKNIHAVHLVKGKTNMIGVVLPYVNHPYFNNILEGAAREALVNGYRLVVCQTNYQKEKEQEALDMLKVKQVDGILICSRANDWDTIEDYVSYGPIVTCEDAKGHEVSSVFINHYEGFMTGMNYLFEKGYRKIGYCIARKESANSQKRKKAYVDALKMINEPIKEEWMFHDCLTIEDGERLAQELFHMKHWPEALLVASDQVAAGVILACQKYGWDIPGDLAVVGFDNHPIAHVLGMTTIEHPSAEMGTEAFRLLHRQIHQKAGKEDRELTFRLLKRKSA
jgi:LacI family transcriptional regulator, repressor for deo operon, udp, cdd, tsx, nupC, and nupG